MAHLGHNVRCADVDPQRIGLLRDGVVPQYEEGLGPLLNEALESGSVQFLNENRVAAKDAEFTFLCVPTPAGADGRADMRFIKEATEELAGALPSGAVVVNKSTVPVGSTRVVEKALRRPDVAVVSNPEFLREGTAVSDFFHPDRIVIGAPDEATGRRVAALFGDLSAPLLLTDAATAETIKYASNAFLATKVSFANALAAICEAVGADVREVVRGMGSDPRIGPAFLQPGPGWGGSCLPKDTAALVRIAEDAGYDFRLLKEVIEVNEGQRVRVVEKAARLVGGSLAGKTVTVLGLAFKAGTDDTRESPALDLARRLLTAGSLVRTFDPAVNSKVDDPLIICEDPYSACQDADVLIVATEWEHFSALDFEKIGGVMAQRAIVDARNLLDAHSLRALGFTYEGVGVP